MVNHIVVFRLDPVSSWIRPGPHTSPYEWIILWVLLALLAVGAIFALHPSSPRWVQEFLAVAVKPARSPALRQQPQLGSAHGHS